MTKIIAFIIRPKTIIMAVTMLVSVNLAVSFFSNYLYRSKAAGETITVNMSSDGVNLGAGEEKTINIDIISPAKDISGFDLNFKTSANLNISIFGEPVAIGGTEPYIFTKIVKNAKRIVYVVKKSDDKLPNIVRIPATVKLLSAGRASVELDLETSQVSGNISSYTFNFDPAKVQSLIFNPEEATPALTPGPTGESGKANLNIKLKFQGVTGALDDTRKTMPVKITVKRGTKTILKPTKVDFTVDDKGIWSGSTSVDSGTGYTVLVKGPMHIQKKICDSAPDEEIAGTYNCAVGKVDVNAGDNNLDFSGIMIMAGDLPLTETGGQDGIADSADIGYIINNLGNKDSDIIAIADLNRNGGVDAADFSIEQFALSQRPDEQ